VTTKERTLPLFSEPPVVETVLGVQFIPLKGFGLQHFGLFWSKVREEYPKLVSQPSLPRVIENFEEKIVPKPEITVSLPGNLPDLRGWYLNLPETRLIQIQGDRFLYNWKKVKGNETYPQFDTIQPEFKSNWGKFCEFLTDEGIDRPELTQCEVTYVNHIEIGKGWDSFGEFNKVFAPWSGEFSGSFLPTPEKMTLNATFVIPNEKGRLHISAMPAIRRSDGKEIVKVELTARGRPNNSTLDAVVEWFQIGHKWIVQGFADLTTDHMHKIWRRTI
jgi:uncharacterized protein (TIGR04255 family)